MEFVLTLTVLVSLAVGVLCTLGYRQTRQKLYLMSVVPTCTVADLADRLPGEVVELKGSARCATPLTSEITGQPCVYYRSVTRREYERTSLDSKGHASRQRGSETIAENEQRVPFVLEDGTGRVTVNPFGAEIDARKLVDRFEPHAAPGGTITIGVSIQFSGDSRTLGYRKVEHAALVDRPVYMLGVL